MADRVQILFKKQSWGPRNIVLDGDSDSSQLVWKYMTYCRPLTYLENGLR